MQAAGAPENGNAPPDRSGPGRTTNPADFTSVTDDLEERIFGPMDDKTWIYLGHGKATTLRA